MLTYLLSSAGVSFLGAFILYRIIQNLIKRGRISNHQGRGFFVMMLAFWVFIASALDYFFASPELLAVSQEQRIVPMMLVNASVSLAWLLWGAANIDLDNSA
jgi:hypothetical protein